MQTVDKTRAVCHYPPACASRCLCFALFVLRMCYEQVLLYAFMAGQAAVLAAVQEAPLHPQ